MVACLMRRRIETVREGKEKGQKKRRNRDIEIKEKGAEVGVEERRREMTKEMVDSK